MIQQPGYILSFYEVFSLSLLFFNNVAKLELCDPSRLHDLVLW